MSAQTARQAARRAALDAQGRLRTQRAERETRLGALAVKVAVALGEWDALVAARELAAARSLRVMTTTEGLPLREALQWCAVELSAAEARRLLRLADADPDRSRPPRRPRCRGPHRHPRTPGDPVRCGRPRRQQP